MSVEKMREEFEFWYLAEYFEGDKDCGLEWLSTEPCGSYRYERPSTQWKIWQASRSAIEVELPIFTEFSASDSPGYVLERCAGMIEYQGLKVKA